MKNRSFGIVLVLALCLSACGNTPITEVTPTQVVFLQTPQVNLLPTNTGIPQPTAVCPNPDCIIVRATGQSTPLRLSLPTPGNEPISGWRPPQYPVPLALGPFDHFYFARPIAADVVNWPVASYRYGGTELSPGITHTGVDIPSLAGTPVLATGPGIVTWAGWGLFSNTPENTRDPYGIAVAIRHDFGYQGRPLYSIYAHLQDVNVTIGQWVTTGEKIGFVGDTGYTTGPHLHFELRIGKDSYYNTLNPELWIAPPQGWGVLAGKVLGANREPIHSQPVSIRSLDNNQEWIVNTYGPEAVNPDEYYNENMVISDLPAGRYAVKITIGDNRADIVELTIKPGRVSYFVYRASFGFISSDLPPVLTPTPVGTGTPMSRP